MKMFHVALLATALFTTEAAVAREDHPMVKRYYELADDCQGANKNCDKFSQQREKMERAGFKTVGGSGYQMRWLSKSDQAELENIMRENRQELGQATPLRATVLLTEKTLAAGFEPHVMGHYMAEMMHKATLREGDPSQARFMRLIACPIIEAMGAQFAEDCK